MTTTVGQLLVNNALPEDLRDHARTLDGTAVKDLLGEVARRYPEKYREISQRLSDVGWRAAQESGGFSFGMQHLRKSRYATNLHNQLRQRIQLLLDDDALDDKQREDSIVKLVGSRIKDQQDNVFEEAKAAKNPLALQVLSKARGNKMNLTSLLGSDLLYADHRDQIIPVPVLSSYAEGLKPWEYWAGTYGARKGVIDLKFATQDAGFLGKQLNQATHRLVVEDLDHDGEPDSVRGLPVDTDDPDNEGALLAHDAGPYKRNTVLTPKVLRHIRQLGRKRILVRSPTVGGTRNGGVYARDVGVREHGTLPGRGEFPGMAAAQAISEPLSQGMLSSKHTGGVAGEGKAVSGFDYVNQLVQVPHHFKGGAAHAEVDGVVARIEDAPAGGKYMFINGERHYIPDGATPSVQPGDTVEAGDVISDGMPNPAKVVEHKGVGEGRRYFVHAFRDAMSNAGIPVNRRNVELLARGLINHVRLDDELGDYVPEDIVPYSTLEHVYEPRKDASEVEPSLARDKYLEKPALHYTIGTRVRPSVMKDLAEFGVKKVTVHDQPPPFKPEMIRGMYNLANDPDWMTRQYGSGIKGSLLRGAHRGATSDEAGSSFVPSLAKSVDFGRSGIVHKPDPGWQPQAPAAIKISTDGVPNGVPGSGDNFHMGDGKAPGIDPIKPSTVPSAPPAAAKPAVPAAAPAPAQPRPPEYRAAPYFGGYQPSQNMLHNPLMQSAMRQSHALGPLAPLALLAGLDWNALGTLTRGPSQDNVSTTPPLPQPPLPQPPAQPTAQPPVSAQPSSSAAPQTNESFYGPAVTAQQLQARAASKAQAPAATPPAPGWWDITKNIGKHYVSSMAEPINKEHPASDVWQRYNTGVDLARLGSWASRLPLLRSIPGAGVVGGLGGSKGILSKAAPGLKGQLGVQTLLSTGQGAWDAFRAGGGNPLKGYDITSEKMTQPADPNEPSIGGVAVGSGLQNGTMDPITTGVAFGKTVNRLNKADPSFSADAGNAVAPFPALRTETPPAYESDFDQRVNREQMGKALDSTGGTQNFSYSVYQDGTTRLVDKVTGQAVPTNGDEFFRKVPPQYQQEIAARLYHEKPDKFLQMFGDLEYAAQVSNGQQPSAAAAARQRSLSQQWREIFGQ